MHLDDGNTFCETLNWEGKNCLYKIVYATKWGLIFMWVSWCWLPEMPLSIWSHTPKLGLIYRVPEMD